VVVAACVSATVAALAVTPAVTVAAVATEVHGDHRDKEQ
jgi:hypothetical protein